MRLYTKLLTERIQKPADKIPSAVFIYITDTFLFCKKNILSYLHFFVHMVKSIQTDLILLLKTEELT